MKRIFLILLATILLPIGVTLGVGIPAAYAQTGNTYCADIEPGAECLNAWGGGPEVNVYNGVSADYNLFEIYSENSGAVQIIDSDGGPYDGACIGDYGNSSTDARAGLDPCGARNGSGAGWGTIMQEETAECPSGSVAFHDNHWGGYLSYDGTSNGDPFYVNSEETCFYINFP
jgi:hypothetical protein